MNKISKFFIEAIIIHIVFCNIFIFAVIIDISQKFSPFSIAYIMSKFGISNFIIISMSVLIFYFYFYFKIANKIHKKIYSNDKSNLL